MFKINTVNNNKIKPSISVGLDISAQYAKAVQIARSEGGVKLLKYGIVKFDPKGGKQAKISAIQGAINNSGIKSERVNISVSGQFVIVRYLDFPKMSKEDLKKAISFELDKYVPFKQADVYYDISILPPSTDGKCKVLLAVAKKEVVHEYIDLLKDAGLMTGLVDVKLFSLVNAFQFASPPAEPEDVTAVINIDSDLVVVDILKGGKPCFSRDIIGGKIDLASLILNTEKLDSSGKPEANEDTAELLENASNLLKELRGSLSYFESESQKTVNKFFISGEGVLHGNLAEFISREMGVNISAWNPLKFLSVDEGLGKGKDIEDMGTILAFAIGLALRG